MDCNAVIMDVLNLRRCYGSGYLFLHELSTIIRSKRFSQGLNTGSPELTQVFYRSSPSSQTNQAHEIYPHGFLGAHPAPAALRVSPK